RVLFRSGATAALHADPARVPGERAGGRRREGAARRRAFAREVLQRAAYAASGRGHRDGHRICPMMRPGRTDPALVEGLGWECGPGPVPTPPTRRISPVVPWSS